MRNIPAQELKNGPPDEKELLDVIRNLKDGKSSNDIPIEFIKYSLVSKGFIFEMIKLFKCIYLIGYSPVSDRDEGQQMEFTSRNVCNRLPTR